MIQYLCVLMHSVHMPTLVMLFARSKNLTSTKAETNMNHFLDVYRQNPASDPSYPMAE